MSGGTPLAWLEDYRDPTQVRALARSLAELRTCVRGAQLSRPLRIMHVCGTHENALCEYGLRSLLPDWIRLIAGPGCPVCVCPAADIDIAVRLASSHDVILATFGDVVRVPARGTLLEAKARGAAVRVVYGIADAVALAQELPHKQVVFFAVGFETTACTTAAALKRGVPPNFSVLVSHRIVPPALDALLRLERDSLDALILPGHVLTVTGLDDYRSLGAAQPIVPMAVAGFEPVDLMLAIHQLVECVATRASVQDRPTPAAAGRDEPVVFNGYSRAVRAAGNPTALRTLTDVFERADAVWRGLGTIAASGYRLRAPYAAHDAMLRFGLSPDPTIPDMHEGCRCGDVLLGRSEPEDCPLYATACNPDRPIGTCMVAFEGTCRARFRSHSKPHR